MGRIRNTLEKILLGSRLNDPVLLEDMSRHGAMPDYQRFFRLLALPLNTLQRKYCWRRFLKSRRSHLVDLEPGTVIGPGLYLGHPSLITITAMAVIGRNCHIHKGVTIGADVRGARKGAPVLGDRVWVGINATVVGAVTIGDDVLIAPNSFVNQDIPPHSIVMGNPCRVIPRPNATEGFIAP